MTGAASTHELRKYSENGQLPLAPAACEPGLGWDPDLAHQSPLCAALTAFTELVVARLGVFAAFASLTDGCTQRVLAGTWGQTDGDGRDDALPRWLASRDADGDAWLSLARRTLGLDHQARDRAFPDGGIAVQLDRDRRAANLSCVAGPPHVKYYAAVPIRTRRRICIGTLFVLDRVIRDRSFDDDLTFLSSIAAKCMTQLETARESHLKSRITRISDGVCSFIHSRAVGPDESSNVVPSSSNPTSAQPSVTATPDQASSTPTGDPLPSAPQDGSTNETQAAQADTNDASAGGSGRTTYKEAFARAALHLRNALDVDGVLFVDGLIGFHGALTPLAKREQELEDEMNQKFGRKDTSKEDLHWTPTPDTTDARSPDDAKPSDDASGPAERTFSSTDYQKSTLVRRPGEILAVSVGNPKARPRLRNLSINAPDEDYIDERFLRRFLARYPSGKFERRRHKSKHKIPESPWALENKDTVEESEHDLHGLLAPANIATLCEEVVEVTAGGHSFNKPTSTDDLTITLDVSFQDNWNFLTEPGALRRIMTNILGNALKYTEKGFVKVGLDIEDISSEPASSIKPGSKLKLIVFTVADSGKGMSKEFLEKHLSVPFTQEDTMASQGVGLGMSIVKSLVAMLGGKIKYPARCPRR
ncbi:putative two-component sensor protein histidine protein kinase (dhkj) protein [Neofusicoccum parvum UCRNP2]|uniref:histidine kinase n=1 Tax=Botryosphaeria parva (strain UCR-NP2) TaxID=1287680 RepID=R1GLK2_BOTPV|nr:putative two-component sensor protein histidine protein kinase (dhkj) protein [Neofusicoccum parvum UCRNP2]